MMKSILITGGAGFIGSQLIKMLLKEGIWNITTIDNFDPFYSRSIKENNIHRFKDNPDFHFVEQDILNFDWLRNNLAGDYEIIVHLAAKAGVRPSIKDPAACQEVNVRGTQNILELARMWGTKQFIFSSSSSVYGINPDVPWCEDDKVLLPISPYAASKVAGELTGHVYSYLYDIRFLALRLFTVYGPGQRPDLAIHKFTKLMLDGKQIQIFGDGTTKRDYTYVDDIVQGIRAAMDYQDSMYEVINLGNNHTIELKELIKAIEENIGVKAQICKIGEQAGDVPKTHADISKAQKLLGYKPKTNLKQGLKKFYEWIQQER